MKCDATISYNEIMETGGIVLRRCPITNGVETRMTEAGFKAVCTATRKRGRTSFRSPATPPSKQ